MKVDFILEREILMESGYTSLAELAEKLKTIQKAACRMALQRKDGQWFLFTVLVDVLPNWSQEEIPCYNYNYGQAAFIAGTTSGTEVAKWLLDRTGEIGEYAFQYAPGQGQDITSASVYWTRHPSYASTGFSKIAYPFTFYQVRYNATPYAQPTDFLVANDCPFFRDFQTAISQLINEEADPNHIGVPQEGIFLRFIHTEARIKHIEISPTILSFEVEGTNLLNTQLQISGPPELQVYERISQSKHVDCLLPNGMPPEVWVVLSRGNEWLDYVYLGQRWSPFKQNNVTFSPPDIRTRIQELIAQGEGPTIEFKQEIPTNHDHMLKTVAAFANGSGGVILLGVADSGDIIGITGDVNREKDRISSMIHSTVDPVPQVRIEHGDINGRQVIAIYVDAGILPLYGIHPNKPDFYVRRGATTFRAKQEDIVALAQRKQPEKWYQQ